MIASTAACFTHCRGSVVRRASPVLILLGALPTPAAAQARREDVSAWGIAMATLAVGKDAEITIDGHVGLNDRASEAKRFFIRAVASRRIADGLWIGAGAGYFYNAEPFAPVIRERRLPGELSYRSAERPGRAIFLLRTRLEERREDSHQQNAWQVRQLARLEVPISGGGRPARVIGWHESFVSLKETEWTGRSGPASMFNFLGVGAPVGRKLRLEVGYLNVTTFIPGRNRVRYGPALILSARL